MALTLPEMVIGDPVVAEVTPITCPRCKTTFFVNDPAALTRPTTPCPLCFKTMTNPTLDKED